MPVKRVEDALWSYRDRIEDLKKDRRFSYILVFKNEGESAGATLDHSHSQLIALPIVPKSVIEEVEGAKQHYNLKERCIYCDIIRQETMTGSRMIAENRDFVSFAPFAPRFPFETWIMPKTHSSNYSSGTPEQYANLALILQETLKRLDRVLPSRRTTTSSTRRPSGTSGTTTSTGTWSSCRS